MYTALVSAGTSTGSGFSITNLVVLIVVLAVAVPFFRKLRGSVSEKRRRCWEQEGLMDPPAAGPEAGNPPDQSKD
jgi:hypothetical protein